MKFLGISFNISELMNKMIFPQFRSCSCDVILPSFAYQDGGLHITSFLTLNGSILRTASDMVNGVLFYFVRSYVLDQHVFLVNFPFKI